MLILHLLFFATIGLLLVYTIFGALPEKNDAVIKTLSWALAVHVALFVFVLLTSCRTDSVPVRVVYVVAALLVVGNAILDTMDESDSRKWRILGMAAITVGVVSLGSIRTEMFKQCVRYKGLIKASYAAQRDPNAPREQKIDIAERVIRDLGLAPSKIRRILRL